MNPRRNNQSLLCGGNSAAGTARCLLALLLLGVSPLSLAQVEGPAGQVLDGSFESGTPNSFWNEFSQTFVTPICNLQVCGTGDGSSQPRTGSFWVWFGGAAGLMEFGFVDQEVVLPPGDALLTFYLWNGSADSGGTDAFEFGVDSDVLLTVVEGDPAYTDGYALVEIDLAAYADGGTHVLFFRATDFDGDNTNFALDDISLNGPITGGAFPIPALSHGTLALLALLLLLAGFIALGSNRPRRH